MGERNANLGPRYAIRLHQLRRWHLILAKCGMCGHRRAVRLWQLRAALRERDRAWAYLGDVERRLVCQRCGNRHQNQIIVLVKDSEEPGSG